MDDLKKNAKTAADFLKGIANPHRLSILCNLSQRELSVSELINKTGISQTSMSQHLSKLRQEGLTDFRRDHRTLYYYIKNDAVTKIIEILYKEFCNKKKEKK